MAYNYEKLWKLLDANDMKRTDLIREAGITSNSLARMGKGEDVRLEALAKICKRFNCKLDDVVDIVDREEYECQIK